MKCSILQCAADLAIRMQAHRRSGMVTSFNLVKLGTRLISKFRFVASVGRLAPGLLGITLAVVCIGLYASPGQGSALPPEGGSRGGSTSVGVSGDTGAMASFATATEQLRHARAWFSDTGEKRAALKGLLDRYHEANAVRAEAELELAYLALGADYRFAPPSACLQAVAEFRRVADQYPELPDICAKAHWYMGWIYADLLHKKPEALVHFHIIVDRFAAATLKIEPPVPWVSLVLPQAADQPRAVYDGPAYSWRSMALLEIIRDSDAEHEKWAAFQLLWKQDRPGVATGHALQILLQGPATLARRTVPYARLCLKTKSFSRPLAEEIEAALLRPDLNPAIISKKPRAVPR